ncbi:MAG: ester cyclase, partial [Actinomycetota bacterium]|nr:ester cyclase [Actinomycetota bacterium]
MSTPGEPRDAIDEIYAADIVWHVPVGDIRGSKHIKQFVDMYLSAFPDMRVTIEDAISEGDKVVTRWTMRGTHQGELMDIAPHREADRARRCHHTP